MRQSQAEVARAFLAICAFLKNHHFRAFFQNFSEIIAKIPFSENFFCQNTIALNLTIFR